MNPDRLHSLLGQRPDRLRTMAQGLLGPIYEARFADGRILVVKTADGKTQGLLTEAAMLRYLAAQSRLPVPQVHHADQTCLVMDKIEGRGSLNVKAQQHAGELLADLHSIEAESFGFDQDTTIGLLPQPNTPTASWRDFFRDQRLLHMAQAAFAEGKIDQILLARIERLAEHLDAYIDDGARPALIHGDMWSGNVIAQAGRIVGLIDPAIYYADPEIELAFATLFGTFGDAFFRRYHEIRPMRLGFFEQRMDLYNLYPLLVHVRHFGGSYVASVQRTLTRFGY